MDAQGRVKIVDRKKDMISVSGFKVFPNEVEDVAMMQGGVLECAAVGVPDPHSGEAVKLFAVKKIAGADRAGLARATCTSKLAGYKMPKYIEFRNELPKTNVGKILRRALRDDDVSGEPCAEVVAFWREAGPERWFEKDDAFDEEIRERFLRRMKPPPPASSAPGKQSAEGALALLILLDQFPRNMFRGEARAFATDPLARAIAAGALVRGFDAQVPDGMRGFFYLPFEHSENLADQERGVDVLQGDRRRRRPEMGGTARRYHPPLRPISAPQHGARPRHHGGGASVSRWRRFFSGCAIIAWAAAQLLGKIAPIKNAGRFEPARSPGGDPCCMRLKRFALADACRRVVLAMTFDPMPLRKTVTVGANDIGGIVTGAKGRKPASG